MLRGVLLEVSVIGPEQSYFTALASDVSAEDSSEC